MGVQSVLSGENRTETGEGHHGVCAASQTPSLKATAGILTCDLTTPQGTNTNIFPIHSNDQKIHQNCKRANIIMS